MSNDNVTPMSTTWIQTRQTKLGLTTVTIHPMEDLVHATVTISYEDTIFRAEGIFSSIKEAFMWAYGVKQTRNDRYAGYQVKEGNLVETKPAKNRPSDVISIKDALLDSQADYDNFDLKRASTTSDKVSLASVKASTLLSEEEKIVMASLFAKLGKVSNA